MKPHPREFSLWPLRLCIASVMVVHGWWMLTDLTDYGDLFVRLGIPLGHSAALLVGVAEFFGGLGLVAGILTRFTSVVLSVVMATAILVAWLPEGPFYGGWAFDLVILGGLLALLVNGPGRPTLASVFNLPWRDPEEWVWHRLRG